MSALAFPVPHLDAIGRLPQGLLYPHQADGVVFLIAKGRAILADDMGLGKTRQAIVAMQVAVPDGAILSASRCRTENGQDEVRVGSGALSG